MVLTYGFYNSVDGDRTYNAEQFSEFFDGIIGDGVLQGVGQAFKATASGNTITIGSGRAWFNKTWSYNDDDVVLELPSASNINKRIDTLVLQVDTTIEGRQNTFEFVLGDPSVSPTAPVLNTTAGIYQYPLYNITRQRDNNNITQSNVTSRIGTSACPFATNTLLNLDTYDVLGYKRTTVRGQYLGSSVTAAQKLAIRNGTFEGLYLGDYWRYNNTNWRIVDFDYWYKRQEKRSPDTRQNEHHVVVVPDDDRFMYANVRPFTSKRKASNCGVWYATNVKNRCNSIANIAKQLFGASNIVTRVIPWQTTLSTARFAMNVNYAHGIAAPMSEYMVHGARNLALPSATMDTQQLALYAINERYVWMGHDRGEVPSIPSGRGSYYGAFWKMGQYSMENWTCTHDWSGATAHNPSQAARGADHQIRPVMGIMGKP